jgi:hypothetical protein
MSEEQLAELAKLAIEGEINRTLDLETPINNFVHKA